MSKIKSFSERSSESFTGFGESEKCRVDAEGIIWCIGARERMNGASGASFVNDRANTLDKFLAMQDSDEN